MEVKLPVRRSTLLLTKCKGIIQIDEKDKHFLDLVEWCIGHDTHSLKPIVLKRTDVGYIYLARRILGLPDDFKKDKLKRIAHFKDTNHLNFMRSNLEIVEWKHG
jgi:hypothetical protein